LQSLHYKVGAVDEATAFLNISTGASAMAKFPENHLFSNKVIICFLQSQNH